MAKTQARGNTQLKADTITNAEIKSSAAIALSKLAEAVIQADGGQAFSGDQSMGTNKITDLAAPTSANDAARKVDVDAAAQGLDCKDSVRIATTANVALTGEQTIDGFLTSADRILVKNQSTASENGIYVTAAGAWARSADADSDAEVNAGMFVFVEEGTINADSGWVITTDDPITLGTTALAFAQFSGAGQITAGAGMTKTGNTLDVGTGNGMTVNADDITVKPDATGGANLAKAIDVNANGVAVKVDGSTVQENGSSQLEVKDAGIVTAKIADDAVDATKLKDDASTDANRAVTTNHIRDNAITTAKINALAVDTAELAADAVTTAKIAALAVTPAELAANAVETAKIADDAVTAAKIPVAVAGDGITGGGGSALAINRATRETPTGAIDGANTTYTLANTPIVGTEEVYLNGIQQDAGAGNDYTISGLTITYLTAPVTGDKLRVSYFK